jgi:hypothetical protein
MSALAALILFTGAVRSVVAQGAIAIKENEPPASVTIIMVDGRAENKGCAGGFVWTGRFIVSVRSTTGDRETDLNALLRAETLTFPEHSYWHVWPIHFDDYNHDGHPDFNLTPFTCGNNGFYTLFTISPDGGISRLPVIPDAPLILFGGDPSSDAIKVTPEGIKVGAYDNSVGAGFTSTYRWDKERGAFVLVKPVPSAPTPTPIP